MGALARAHGGSSMCEAASRVCERARVRVRELGLGLGLSLSDLNNDARLTTDVPTVMGWVRAWFGWFGRYGATLAPPTSLLSWFGTKVGTVVVRVYIVLLGQI